MIIDKRESTQKNKEFRSFIAISPSGAVRDQIKNTIVQLSHLPQFQNMRWVVMPNLHLTLYFLGTTPENHFDLIKAEMKCAAKEIQDFTLILSELSFFPHSREKNNAKVLWLGLKDDSVILRKFHIRFKERLAHLKSESQMQQSEFLPHVSIGYNRKLSLFLDLNLLPIINPIPWEVNAIDLYSSHSSHQGVYYTKLYSVLLGR